LPISAMLSISSHYSLACDVFHITNYISFGSISTVNFEVVKEMIKNLHSNHKMIILYKNLNVLESKYVKKNQNFAKEKCRKSRLIGKEIRTRRGERKGYHSFPLWEKRC
jgi:transcription elongation factor